MNTHSPLNNVPQRDSEILCINFNQDQGCFAVGLETGFLVYNSNPIDLRVKRQFNTGANARTTSPAQILSSSPPQGPAAANGASGSGSGSGPGSAAGAGSSSSSAGSSSNAGSGIGHITMLHRTNYLALVGGGKNPKFPNNKLIIWDDLKRKNSLSLDFNSPVLNVLLSRIRIIVVLRSQVLVYGFSAPPRKFATYETIDNEFGLADLSVNSMSANSTSPPLNGFVGSSPNSSASTSPSKDIKYQTLAFPGKQIGQIQLVDVSPQGQEKNLVSIIKAHKSKIRCLSLNRSGTLVASASETGTIIRVHSTHNTALLYEFRRGLDRAVITSMKFSHNDSKLAVLSEKNTLHIFSLLGEVADSTSSPSFSLPTNRRHFLRNLPLPVPIPQYFRSTWSFCSVNTNQYHGEQSNLPDTGVIGWAENDSVIIIWKEKRIWERYVIVNKAEGAGALDLVRYDWKSVET